MDDISSEEYEKVLKYMETVNQQNFQKAIATMKSLNYNLQSAINNHYQPNVFQRNNHQNYQENDEQIIRKYIQFIQKKNQSWNILTVILDIIIYIITGILMAILRLLPSTIYNRFLGTPFQKLYYAKLKNKYIHKKISYYLPKTKNLDRKSILLIISPPKEHLEILTFLNDQNIQKIIRQNFFLSCYVVGNKELQGIQGNKQSPQIIAIRWNIFQEIKIVGSQKNLKNITVNVLKNWAHESRNLFKRDGNVLVKYRNYIARFHGIYYQQQQEEQINLVERQIERKQIHQQNKAYELAQEESKRNKQKQMERRLKQQQEQRAKQELQEQRNLRKMSIPDQPTSGDIIRLSFRCPDGSSIFRNFASNEKLELVYHWVQLNEEIEFEDEKRQFQIMYSYPPVPLSSQKEKLLSQIFESSQEKVVIRQV